MKKFYATILTLSSVLLCAGQIKIGSGIGKFILGDGANIRSDVDLDFSEEIDEISLGNQSELSTSGNIIFGENQITIGDGSILESGGLFSNRSHINFGMSARLRVSQVFENEMEGLLNLGESSWLEVGALNNSGTIDFNNQSDIDITVSENMSNLSGGRILISGNNSTLTVVQDLLNEQGAFINIEVSEVTLSVLGNIHNDGEGAFGVFNSGTIDFGGNFTNTGTFDSSEGEIKLSGSEDQMIPIPTNSISKFTMDKIGGEFVINSGTFEIRDQLNLTSGVIKVEGEGKLLVNGGEVFSDNTGFSYIDGSMVWRDIPANNVPRFPMGKNGFYNPITLFGASQQDIEVTYKNPNPGIPNPGLEVIGVSSLGLWELRRLPDLEEDDFAPSMDSIQIQIDFEGEDFVNFAAFNNIRTRSKGPSILIADTTSNEFNVKIYNSLFTTLSENNSTDSTLFAQVINSGSGSLITQDRILLVPDDDTVFLALGVAPFIPNGLLPYIPNVFSPNSQITENKVVKIYGENLIEGPDFRFEIYNKYGALVYSANSLEVAKTDGWNGKSISGSEEPQGTYFYQINDLYFLDKNGEIELPLSTESSTGQIYLIR